MADLKEARVPDIGGHGDVPVIEVLVSVGDTVSKDQGLVTLESDKATMEVPAPFAGVVRELKVKLGDTLSEGGLVAMIEPVDAAPEAAKAPEAEAPAKEERKQEPKVESEPAPLAPAKQSPADTATPMGAGLPPVRFEADAVLPDKVPYASPAVRLFARELGVDLTQVSGSERGGRISKEDVQKFIKSVMAGGASAAATRTGGSGGGLDLIPWPKIDFAKFGEIE
ncbi:MAG: biotin/lipoyl-containing protein, partial [Thermomonas sp.]